MSQGNFFGSSSFTYQPRYNEDDDADDMQTDHDLKLALAESMKPEYQDEEAQMKWAMSASVAKLVIDKNDIYATDPKILVQLGEVFKRLGLDNLIVVLPGWQQCHGKQFPNSVIYDFHEKGYKEFCRHFDAQTKTAQHIRNVAKDVGKAFLTQLKEFTANEFPSEQERNAKRFDLCLTLMNDPNTGLWSAYKKAFEEYKIRKAKQATSQMSKANNPVTTSASTNSTAVIAPEAEQALVIPAAAQPTLLPLHSQVVSKKTKRNEQNAGASEQELLEEQAKSPAKQARVSNIPKRT